MQESCCAEIFSGPLRPPPRLFTAASYSRVRGANDRIRLGLIGAGGRGLSVMGTFQKNAEVQVVAVCDVYGARVERAKSRAAGAAGFTDHRKLLEAGDLDAVLIATPDHWHAAIAIDALRAGKDVYVEKPLTLRIEEGPAIVKAARENDRICQVGMQQRSGPHYMRARDEVRAAGQAGQDHARPHVVARQRRAPDEGAARAARTSPPTSTGRATSAR